jgi:hypothetical protein
MLEIRCWKTTATRWHKLTRQSDIGELRIPVAALYASNAVFVFAAEVPILSDFQGAKPIAMEPS